MESAPGICYRLRTVGGEAPTTSPGSASKEHAMTETDKAESARSPQAPAARTAPQGLRELLELAVELARAAGEIHVAGRHAALRVETKSTPTDLVSQVDREAEQLIVTRLAEARPNDSLLAEEGSLLHGMSGVRWIVDPLDGTTNYVYGYPGYAVSIAAEIDGQPALGVVYDSSGDRLYQAISGYGAACDGRPLQVSPHDNLATALVATGFAYDAAMRARQGAIAGWLLSRVRDLRRGGSAALDLCHVAAGHVNAYWETGLSPWDYAAGAVIAREAGAEVRILDVANPRGPLVIAAPPSLMPALLALLDEAGALEAAPSA